MQLAGLGSRFVAQIIDGIILAVIGGVLATILGSELGGVLSFVIGLTYNWYFWTNNKGQTPGKSVMGVRVVKTGGGGLSTADAVVRYIGYYVNTILLFLGWIWAIFDDKNQGFHDKLAGTIVVKA
jgi:uncharacterized RDD family membrane protein YckC